jgi:hypothetical protein
MYTKSKYIENEYISNAASYTVHINKGSNLFNSGIYIYIYILIYIVLVYSHSDTLANSILICYIYLVQIHA